MCVPYLEIVTHLVEDIRSECSLVVGDEFLYVAKPQAPMVCDVANNLLTGASRGSQGYDIAREDIS